MCRSSSLQWAGMSLAAVSTSHCSVFSYGAKALGLMGFSSCGTWVQLPWGMWDPPRPETELVSLALQGGYFVFFFFFFHRAQKTLFIHAAPEKGRLTSIWYPLGLPQAPARCASAHPASSSPRQRASAPLLPGVSGNCSAWRRRLCRGTGREERPSLMSGETYTGGTILSVTLAR